MFRHEIAIRDADIDFMGHVNNAVYLNWVQESVIAYWRAVAPTEDVAQHLWVALKHEISYRRPAFLKDVVVADGVASIPRPSARHGWHARRSRGSSRADFGLLSHAWTSVTVT